MGSQANAVQQWHLDRVSHHINQTMLVNHLLSVEPDLWDDISGWNDDEYGNRPEIFQWLAFPDRAFCGLDYDDLIAAEIPVLDTDYGTWVGITSFGSPYEVYVYPQLIQAVFHVKCDYEALSGLRRP